jgi:hypothetical protein
VWSSTLYSLRGCGVVCTNVSCICGMPRRVCTQRHGRGKVVVGVWQRQGVGCLRCAFSPVLGQESRLSRKHVRNLIAAHHCPCCKSSYLSANSTVNTLVENLFLHLCVTKTSTASHLHESACAILYAVAATARPPRCHHAISHHDCNLDMTG